MARKPNYNFQRMERERKKAAKKEARAQAKAERIAKKKAAREGDEADEATSDGAVDDQPT